ncbi:MAG: hypothetical protein EA001_14880 [Oscillatoriales cyanobacterium]|nr:MAG: hypothetical protein EA001_14880 [Oscillatoriales cyanobacterium]
MSNLLRDRAIDEVVKVHKTTEIGGKSPRNWGFDLGSIPSGDTMPLKPTSDGVGCDRAVVAQTVAAPGRRAPSRVWGFSSARGLDRYVSLAVLLLVP